MTQFTITSKIKKITIIGCAGAGKSTLATKLSLITKLPLFHLDKEYFGKNWQKPDKEAFKSRLDEIINKDEWIIDGNYYSYLDQRLKLVDLVIFLNVPSYICFFRALKRMILPKYKSRKDMAEGCFERFDLNFLKYILTYDKKMKPKVLEVLKKHENVKIISIKNDKDIESLLNNCENV
ncbi:MAG: topology modulation protein [Alphaproteobacteria bacterium ADurb.Bin438]|nr:MAG: topology modulation protein [Alphaproteobacteria bacterium ADurb.Bin438]